MDPLLILAFVVAAFGFLLLLKPEILWNRLQKDKTLSGAMAALLRLCGIGCMALSVVIAQWVG